MKEYISVGQIINTHGLNGEVKVLPLTDSIKAFKDIKRIFIDNKETSVLDIKFQNDRVILKIEGIDSIEVAMKYKNKYIEVKREDAEKFLEGSFFVADLIGCTVYDENGEDLGKISDVIKTKNNDVYWIKGKKELLIPALKDIVVNINIEEKKVIIKPVSQWMLE